MGHQQRTKLLNEQEMFKRLVFKRGAAEAASGEQAAGTSGPTVPSLRRDERAVKSSSTKPSASKHSNARDSADAPRPPPHPTPPPARAPASETESTLSERPPPRARTAATALKGAAPTAAAASASSSGREAKKRAGEKQRAEMPVVEPLRLPVDSDVTQTARTVDTAREPSSRKSAHSHSRSTLPEQVSTAREVRY